MTWQTANKHDLANAAEKILPAALAYLAKREYSSQELSRKLLQRGAPKEQVEQVIALLQEKDYLSDSRYAAAYVRDRRDFHPCGAAKIIMELRGKGVDSSIIDLALAEEYDEDRQREVVVALLQKAATKANNDNGADNSKYRDKVIRQLLAKGFSQAMILDEISSIFRK